MVPCVGDRTANEQHQRYHRARNSHAGAGARCQTSSGVGTGSNGLLSPVPAAGYLSDVPETSRRPGAGTVSPGDYSSTDPGGRSPYATGRRDGLSGRIARGCSGISPSSRLPRTRTAARGSRSPAWYSRRVQPPAISHARRDTTGAHSSVPDVVAHLSSQVCRTSTRTGTPARAA